MTAGASAAGAAAGGAGGGPCGGDCSVEGVELIVESGTGGGCGVGG